MSGPERLVHHGGPAARLLASARLDAPSPRSRQRALAAAAGAASTLAAAGGSAALSGGAMIKSAAICASARSAAPPWAAQRLIGGVRSRSRARPSP
jgi:hypothetical protein